MDLRTLRTADGGGVIRLAVDAMGGDFAPDETVHGALTYAREHPADEVILVGDEGRVRGLAGADLPPNVNVRHASQAITMEEHPARALREKKDASILVATDLVRNGLADAVVTAGHTGAGMAAAVLRLGRLQGVDRPALAVQMVTDRGPFVFLDIGANPDSSGENLYQYAHMGALFSEHALGVHRPTVALLSIGEEKGKGDQRIQQATELLDGSSLAFIGNVEGKDLVHHPADVVVTDAVTGNVTIKFFEGLSSFIFELLRGEFRRAPRGPMAYALLRPGIERIRRLFDYEVLGGSLLLGVRGTVIITHGRAKRRMVYHAIRVAAACARARVPDLIAETLGGGAPGAARAGATPASVEPVAPVPPEGERAADSADGRAHVNGDAPDDSGPVEPGTPATPTT